MLFKNVFFCYVRKLYISDGLKAYSHFENNCMSIMCVEFPNVIGKIVSYYFSSVQKWASTSVYQNCLVADDITLLCACV